MVRCGAKEIGADFSLVIAFHSNGLQYHSGLGLSFPKWYGTCIFDGHTIDQNLRSCDFGKILTKLEGGYLGHLKPFFGTTKGR